MKKTCEYCGIVDYNHVCPVKARKRNKAKANREDSNIYNTTEWRELRADILSECKYICAYSFYVLGVIKVATHGHHIIEILEDKTKAYDKKNVIGLDSETHEEIHRLYKTKYKQEVIKLLTMCKQDIESNIRLEDLGKYRVITDSWI